MALGDLRLGILGLGQIGGSIASCLSSGGACGNIVGFDPRTELTAAALERRAVNGVASSEAELIALSDIVVIAVPVVAIMAILQRHHDALRPKVAVTDTGSVKQDITQIAESLDLCDFVGGHPLAGTEKRGVDSWNGTLFKDANYFLTPGESADSQAYAVVNELTAALGARAIRVSAPWHDQVIAVTSSLPHLLAYSLSHVFQQLPSIETDKNELRSSSYDGATRVAESDPEMVFQILWQNRRYLRPALSALMEQLAASGEALDSADEGRLRRFIGRI
ncbi:MAG: prephenate dehydrogenase [Candidatus Zixiibacteriota bacterium]